MTGDDPVRISFDLAPPEDLVADRTPVIRDHYDIDEIDARRLADAVDRGREEGWSPRKTTQTVYSEVSVPREKVLTIVWNEARSIYTLSSIQQYRKGPEISVQWLAPEEDAHAACEQVHERTADEGVSISRLNELLREAIAEHSGTAERMDHWIPHDRCRATISHAI